MTFDVSKKEFMNISIVEPFAGPSKLLGIEFVNRLLINIAVHNCANKYSLEYKILTPRAPFLQRSERLCGGMGFEMVNLFVSSARFVSVPPACVSAMTSSSLSNPPMTKRS